MSGFAGRKEVFGLAAGNEAAAMPGELGHLARVSAYNLRPASPTAWRLDVHTGPDYLAALDRAGVENDEVEYVIMGQVLQGGAGQAPARQASIGAGLPIEIGSDAINKVCASSIRAVEIADQMIRSGDHDVIVAGGMESMSNAPFALEKARFGYKLGDGTLIDLMTHDGLISTFDNRHMVEQASFDVRTDLRRDVERRRERFDPAVAAHDRRIIEFGITHGEQ